MRERVAGPLRSALAVIQDLLDAMHVTVRSHHPTVLPCAKSVDALIQGTAFFPGGSGLWRGITPFGQMPEYFPESPVMFVGHNFDSIRAFNRSLERGGEFDSAFWRRLQKLLEEACLPPEKCSFTNALMGIKPGSATGPMPSVPGYRDQCRRFLSIQVEITQPLAVILLGKKAEQFAAGIAVPKMNIRHPSDWHFRDVATRDVRLKTEGEKIQRFLASIGGPG